MNVQYGSGFTGAGGFDLGLEEAGGFEPAFFIESDPHARAVLRKHWPDTPIYGDITTVDFERLRRIDLFTAGFPCQDISNAGGRAGITGSRSSLWRYCKQAVRVLRPQIAAFENVSALTDRGLDVVLADLAEIGYDAEWHCIPASAVGAPHRRDRIIILAYPDSIRRGRESAKGQGGELQNATCAQALQCSEDVLANSNSGGCFHGQAQEQSNQGREYAQHDVREGSKALPNAYCARLERQQPEERQLARRGWWATEPDLGRVAHGIPHRVDRIKRLGNAAVPIWAKAIGKAIKEVEGW